jgi:DNA uptake protein ComE-like DNA-binding protein
MFFLFMKRRDEKRPSESFVLGVVALVFLMIGFQVSAFVYKASVAKIVANRDEPDTVYVFRDESPLRRNSAHSPTAEAIRQNLPRKSVESFRFDPNTVSVDELCRLGFSPKQAQSIVSYREKGGRFRRKSDFAKSFVVSDSVFRRLENFIDIPLVDLNLADSAAFDTLPGIGGWFASRMVEYRKALGGYSYKEQLMDIRNFDQEKFDALSDLITLSEEHMTPYALWTLPVDSLCRHPYIRNYETAKSIVLYRETTPRSQWTVKGLSDAGIISEECASKLSRCLLLVQ